MVYSEIKGDTQLPEYETVNWNDNVISVKTYLPIEDKITLIQLVAQQSIEDGIFMPVKVDMYMGVYMIFFYSDLEFTDEEKENVPQLFDEMFTSGLYNAIIAAIPVTEVKLLYDNLDKYIYKVEKYNSSNMYLLNRLLEQLPTTMDEVNEVMRNFDPESFAEVMNFARAANGGRDLPTVEKK